MGNAYSQEGVTSRKDLTLKFRVVLVYHTSVDSIGIIWQSKSLQVQDFRSMDKTYCIFIILYNWKSSSLTLQNLQGCSSDYSQLQVWVKFLPNFSNSAGWNGESTHPETESQLDFPMNPSNNCLRHDHNKELPEHKISKSFLSKLIIASNLNKSW